MATNSASLLTAVEGLERALADNAAGRPRDWTDRVQRALAEIEKAVRDHLATLESPEGCVVDVDRPMVPSPVVARKTAQLHQELEGFLQEIRTLRREAPAAAEGCGSTVSPQGLAGALDVAPELGAVPDYGVFCQKARALVTAVEQYEEEEARLILESVTPDVGAGD